MTPVRTYSPPTGHHAAEGEEPEGPQQFLPPEEEVSGTFRLDCIVSTRIVLGRRLLPPATHAVSDPAVLWPPIAMLPEMTCLSLPLLLLLGRPASMMMQQGTCVMPPVTYAPPGLVCPPPCAGAPWARSPFNFWLGEVRSQPPRCRGEGGTQPRRETGSFIGEALPMERRTGTPTAQPHGL